MSYELNWYSIGRVLHLNLINGLSLDEMETINQQVTDTIEKANQKIVVLIDVSALNTGYSTVDQLRNTQRYMNHRKLDAIVVVANNKLNRLISLLVFSLARTPIFQFENAEAANQHLARRGYLVASSSLH